MNQNYNEPLFIFDGTGSDPNNLSGDFVPQFIKQYPTAKDAVCFAKAGGAVIYMESNDGDTVYNFDFFKLRELQLTRDGGTVISFSYTVTYPDDTTEEQFAYVEYVSEGNIH